MAGVVRYSQESVFSSNEQLTPHDDNYLDDFLAFSANEVNEVLRQYSMKFSENTNTINRVVCTDEGKIFISTISFTLILPQLTTSASTVSCD